MVDAHADRIRADVDEMLRQRPDHFVTELARDLERDRESYPGGLAKAEAILAEMRARIAAHVRFWTDEPHDPAAAFLDESLGSWQPIDTVPQTDRVDLWVSLFEFDGELVEECWWSAGAVIPDWYRAGEDGEPELAVPIFGFASHWKKRGEVAGPVEDGGPGLGARVIFDDGMMETWPPAMRDRWIRYYRAVDECEVDGKLLRRGLIDA